MTTRRILFITGICLLILVLTLVLCRNLMLNYIISKAQDRIQQKYNVRFSVGQAAFIGLRTIHIENINLSVIGSDTLLTIQSLTVNPSYQKLLFGSIGYRMLLIDGMNVKAVSDSLGNNYSIKRNEIAPGIEAQKPSGEPNYGSKLNVLFNRVLELVTGQTTVKNFNVEFNSPENHRKYFIPEFNSNGEQYICSVYNLSKPDTISWNIEGKVKNENNKVDFKMVRTSSATSMVSLTGSKKSFKWLVDTLYFEATGNSYRNEEMTIALKGHFSNLQLNHWRISPDDVKIPAGQIGFVIKAGKDYLIVDSVSTLEINKFSCNIGCSYYTKGPVYALNITTGKMPAANLFESLPEGMFNSLQGIKTKGELSYSLEFLINKENPDSLKFESELKKFNFGITKFGNDYLPRINDEFLYTAFDGEYAVRTFPVGPSNPDFTPLYQISPYLKSAVMTAEDGSFMLHGGFNEEAFRQSIATNIKQGRFARGGSTISMQLVKNVFLSRNKTISRKLEEALIVWVIEKNHLVSKERMFEVYLNIIEWGPNVYGIKEASQFYFSKHPSDLSLAESIFLSSIIPHPKYFKYSFDSSGQLKPFLSGFYRLVTDRMLRKNWITPIDTIGLQPVVQLNGLALQYIIPNEAPPDSSVTEDDFIN